jgi:WhiB family redox-sensing transcriptional regulator
MSGRRRRTTIVVMRGTTNLTATTSRPPCSKADPELWFAERPADLHLAKALCGHCPIKAACLAGALDREEPWGVWGGEIIQQGVVLAYKRGRGRPSNADRRLGLVTKVASDPGDTGPELTRPGTTGTFHSRSA